MIAVIMICDGCEEEGYPGLGRADMAKHDWVFTGLNDFCATCASKLPKPPPSKMRKPQRW